MVKLFCLAKAMARDESGSTAIEYVLLGALLGVACIGAFALTGNGVSFIFDKWSGEATNAMGGS